MPFTVEDFRDLVQLLEQHPEWRAELRRQVLSDELLELPALVRQLAEAQVRTEQRLAALGDRVEALAEAQVRTEQRLAALADRVEALVEAQVRTEQRLAALADTVAALAAEVTRLSQQLQGVVDRLGSLDGRMLELDMARKFAAYFGRIARRLRLIDHSRLADLLDDAVDDRRLTEYERDAVMAADLVLSGRRRTDDAEVYLVAEVSVGIGLEDVQRALFRAQLIERLGRPGVPVVAGERITPEADRLAQSGAVWRVLDGHATPPEPAPA